MVNRPRQKGTLGETTLVRYLKDHGFPHAERRALRGGRDCGDVAGIRRTVIEVKNAARLQLGQWIKEARVEAVNAEADVWFVVAKPQGVGLNSVGGWYALTDVDVMCKLLADRGAR